MKQAIFIVGFNNWGKTRMIQRLFSGRKKFFFGRVYRIGDVNARFTVETHSNDDVFGKRWIEYIERRMDHEKENEIDLLAALCPSTENGNDFVELLSDAPFTKHYQRLHLLLLINKWDHHARLQVENIRRHGAGIPNINFIQINADDTISGTDERETAKFNQVVEALRGIYQ